MTQVWPSLLGLAEVVEPGTILRWHRAGFRTYWRWKFPAAGQEGPGSSASYAISSDE
jgi:hypothetical protein